MRSLFGRCVFHFFLFLRLLFLRRLEPSLGRFCCLKQYCRAFWGGFRLSKVFRRNTSYFVHFCWYLVHPFLQFLQCFIYSTCGFFLWACFCTSQILSFLLWFLFPLHAMSAVMSAVSCLRCDRLTAPSLSFDWHEPDSDEEGGDNVFHELFA